MTTLAAVDDSGEETLLDADTQRLRGIGIDLMLAYFEERRTIDSMDCVSLRELAIHVRSHGSI